MPYEEAWEKTAQFANKTYSLNGQLRGVYYQPSKIAFFTRCNYKEAFKHQSSLRAIMSLRIAT